MKKENIFKTALKVISAALLAVVLLLLNTFETFASSSNTSNPCNGDYIYASYNDKDIDLYSYVDKYVETYNHSIYQNGTKGVKYKNCSTMFTGSISGYNNFYYFYPSGESVLFVDVILDDPITSFVKEEYLHQEGDWALFGNKYGYLIHCEKTSQKYPAKGYTLNGANDVKFQKFNREPQYSSNVEYYNSVVTLFDYKYTVEKDGDNLLYNFTPRILTEVGILSIYNGSNSHDVRIAGVEDSECNGNRNYFLHHKGWNYLPRLIKFSSTEKFVPYKPDNYYLCNNEVDVLGGQEYSYYEEMVDKIKAKLGSSEIEEIDFSRDYNYFSVKFKNNDKKKYYRFDSSDSIKEFDTEIGDSGRDKFAFEYAGVNVIVYDKPIFGRVRVNYAHLVQCEIKNQSIGSLVEKFICGPVKFASGLIPKYGKYIKSGISAYETVKNRANVINAFDKKDPISKTYNEDMFEETIIESNGSGVVLQSFADDQKGAGALINKQSRILMEKSTKYRQMFQFSVAGNSPFNGSNNDTPILATFEYKCDFMVINGKTISKVDVNYIEGRDAFYDTISAKDYQKVEANIGDQKNTTLNFNLSLDDLSTTKRIYVSKSVSINLSTQCGGSNDYIVRIVKFDTGKEIIRKIGDSSNSVIGLTKGEYLIIVENKKKSSNKIVKVSFSSPIVSRPGC